jgi:hypothetical protein
LGIWVSQETKQKEEELKYKQWKAGYHGRTADDVEAKLLQLSGSRRGMESEEREREKEEKKI